MAVATALSFASCKENAEKPETETTEIVEEAIEEVAAEEPATVVGVWQLADFEIDMEVPKGQEQALEDMKKKMIESTVYTFNDDSTMSYKNHLVKETTGTYTYADGKLTITNDTTKKDETVMVEELTANKLVLVSEQGGRKAKMIFSK